MSRHGHTCILIWNMYWFPNKLQRISTRLLFLHVLPCIFSQLNMYQDQLFCDRMMWKTIEYRKKNCMTGSTWWVKRLYTVRASKPQPDAFTNADHRPKLPHGQNALISHQFCFSCPLPFFFFFHFQRRLIYLEAKEFLCMNNVQAKRGICEHLSVNHACLLQMMQGKQ